MHPKIPLDILAVYQTIVSAGHKTYFVGGSVRNMLLNLPINDWDIATSAFPEQIQALFSETFYDNTFGTVGIPLKENNEVKTVIQVTTFRSESEYSDKRHPEKVTWGKTIEEDLERRDFSINAIALELTTTQEILIDPYNGQEDLKKKLIKAVGNPDERFNEDALRLLRGVRFATQLGFTIDEETIKAIQKNAPLLAEIAGERIRDELLKIVGSQHAYEGILLLKETGLLHFILPELLEGMGISQIRPGRHHTDDVFTHNVLSLKYCPSEKAIVRLATLVHDIGKPRVKGEDEEGYVTFYNHEVVGAKIASDIADRLRFSKKDKEKMYTLVRWHMFSIEDIISDAAIRRFIRRVGIENIKDMLDVRTADRLGSGAKEDSWRFEKFRERVEQELLPPPFGITDLAINGNDIMKELQMKPGPQIGKMLKQLFEEVDEDMDKNNKEYLLRRIYEINH